MFIAQALAGYSLGQADIFRKAMGKKIPKVMKKEGKTFVAGANKKGISAELAKEVFALIEPFAGYAFNKAHSVSYALIAYHCAYLKANYPTEYMTAYLNTYWDDMEKVCSAVAECRRLGIQVLPPDINRSQADFAIETSPPALSPINGKGRGEAAIRFGLGAIKNVGHSPIASIVSARSQEGSFKSIEDFCHRVDLRNINKKVLESLIKAGTFDPMNSRGRLLESIDKIISLGQMEQRMKESGQAGMFDLWAQTSPALALDQEIKQDEDASIKEKLAWERELLGVYFSSSPLESLTPELSTYYKSKGFASCGEISADMANETVVLVGMVASVRQAYTRDRRPFIIAMIEDLNGSIEVTVWPRLHESTKELWQEGNILVVKGSVKVRDGRVQLNCQQARLHQQTKPAPVIASEATQPPAQNRRRLTINIKQTEETEKDVEHLREVIYILKNYPGQDMVSLVINTGEELTNLAIPNLTIDYCPELATELSKILGEDNWRLEQQLI